MQGGRITLPKEGLLALRDACGVQVKCVRGSLWVTQESDGIDHVLFPGQWVTIDHKGLSIVTARPSPPRPAPPWQGLRTRSCDPSCLPAPATVTDAPQRRSRGHGSRHPPGADQPARNPPSTTSSAPVM